MVVTAEARLKLMDISDEDFSIDYAQAEAEYYGVTPEVDYDVIEKEEVLTEISAEERALADEEGFELAQILLQIGNLVNQHAQQAVETIKVPKVELSAPVIAAPEVELLKKETQKTKAVEIFNANELSVEEKVQRVVALIEESLNIKTLNLFRAEGSLHSLTRLDPKHPKLVEFRFYFNAYKAGRKTVDIDFLWRAEQRRVETKVVATTTEDQKMMKQADKPEFNDFRLSPPRLEKMISNGIDGPLNEYVVDAWNYLDNQTENALAWEVSPIGVAEDISSLFRTRGKLPSLEGNAFATLRFKGKSGMLMNIWIYGNQHKVVTLP
jgi:hypothetical protein